MTHGSGIATSIRVPDQAPAHAAQRVTGALSFMIHAGQRIHGNREFGYGEGMADAPDLAGETQRGDPLPQAWVDYLATVGDPDRRVLLAAALLVTLIPQRVLDRPDPRPSTLVPRWTVNLLRWAIEESHPGIVDEMKEMARKAGRNV